MGDVTCVNCGDRECVCQADIQAGGSFELGLTETNTTTLGGTGVGVYDVIKLTTPTVAQGWECPRCRAINAPHVSRCACSPGLGFVPVPYVPYEPPAQPWSPYDGLQGIQCTAMNSTMCSGAA